MEQACIGLGAFKSFSVELEARATELGKSLEYCASQMRVSECKYLLLYCETQVLNQRLATNVSCDEEMKQCLPNTSQDVSGYMNALHSKAVKS